MQKFTQSQSPLAMQSYNSLQDEHLVEYYSSPQRRRHLRRMGLITKDCRLVDELTFQRRALQREHTRRHRDMMATASATRNSEAQLQRRAELKKKLEALAKYETVQRIKREKLHPLGVQNYRPPPALGQGSPIPGQTSATPDNVPHSRLSRIIETHKDRVTFSPEELTEFKKLVETITGPRMVSPKTPSTRIVPCPPSTPKPKHPAAVKVKTGHAVRRRPQTAPVKTHKHAGSPETVAARPLEQNDSVVKVTLCYLGASVNLDTRQVAVKKRHKQKTQTKKKKEGTVSRELDLPPTGVVVQQQARGYTPVSVYRCQLRPGDSFTFDSVRHTGNPYALSIYTNGMINCRVSVCCEYRHSAGNLLGGKSAHFKVVAVKGGSPCVQCQAVKEERRKSKLKKRKPVDESTDSELEDLKHCQSSKQLSISPQPCSTTQLQGSPRHSGAEEEGRREEGGKSPSPTSSLYSASFHSESPQLSSDEEENGSLVQGRRHSVESLCSLLDSSATLDQSEKEQQQDLGAGSASKVTKGTEDDNPLENHNSFGGEKAGQTISLGHQPSLVTKGGVTIMYQLGPTMTSESATQTEEQPTTQDTDNSPPTDHIATTPSENDDAVCDQNRQSIGMEEGQHSQPVNQDGESTPHTTATTVEPGEKGGEDGDEPVALTQLPASEQVIPASTDEQVQPEPSSDELCEQENVNQSSRNSLTAEEASPAITESTEPTLVHAAEDDLKLNDTNQPNGTEKALSSSTAQENSNSQPLNQPLACKSIATSDVSESTLTQVTERSATNSTNSMGEALELSVAASGSQPDLTVQREVEQVATTQESGDASEPVTRPHSESEEDAGSGAEGGVESRESNTALDEEEFTKAWT